MLGFKSAHEWGNILKIQASGVSKTLLKQEISCFSTNILSILKMETIKSTNGQNFRIFLHNYKLGFTTDPDYAVTMKNK